MINRIKVEDKSEQTIKSYERAVDRLIRFHGLIHPKELDIHEALDFLVSLTEHPKNQLEFSCTEIHSTQFEIYLQALEGMSV